MQLLIVFVSFFPVRPRMVVWSSTDFKGKGHSQTSQQTAGYELYWFFFITLAPHSTNHSTYCTVMIDVTYLHSFYLFFLFVLFKLNMNLVFFDAQWGKWQQVSEYLEPKMSYCSQESSFSMFGLFSTQFL